MIPTTDLPSILATLPQEKQDAYFTRVVKYEFFLPPHISSVFYSLAAPASGGRFTPQRGMKTIYFAQYYEAAFTEANPLYVLSYANDPGIIEPFPPSVVVAVRCQLDSVLNLTDDMVINALQTNYEELCGSWRTHQRRGGKAPTQELGQAIFDSGRFQAIAYPSARQRMKRRMLGTDPNANDRR